MHECEEGINDNVSEMVKKWRMLYLLVGLLLLMLVILFTYFIVQGHKDQCRNQ